MLRQARQWLEQDWKAVQLVPQGEDEADLLDVIARWIPLEKVCLASFLLLNIEF